MQILVVDESPVARHVIRRELSPGPFRVLEAGTAEEALTQFRKERPHLITLNLGTELEPRLSLLERLQASERELGPPALLDRTPVLIITGQELSGPALSRLQPRVAGVVHKPFTSGSLLEQVRTLLEPVALWHGVKVLLADDSGPMRGLMGQLLHSLGATVLEARDGEEALALAQDNEADLNLAVLDQMMPGLTGAQVCRKLRTLPALRGLPVILMSSEDNRSTIGRLYEAGATDYFAKPFQHDEFVARIGVHLRVAAMTRSLTAWKREMEAHLHLAADVQRSAIRKLPALAHAALGTAYLPQQKVSGDIYDCTVTAQGALRVFLGDATGHGVDAALVTTMVVAGLASAEADAPPAAVLEHVHGLLNPLVGERFVTACCLTLAPDGLLTLASAGHAPPLCLRATGELEALDSEGAAPLGMFPGTLGVQERTLRLDAGDRLLLCTDGLAETPLPAGGEFGTERIAVALRRTAHLPVQQAAQAIVAEADAAAEGQVPTDDRTALLIAYQ